MSPIIALKVSQNVTSESKRTPHYYYFKIPNDSRVFVGKTNHKVPEMTIWASSGNYNFPHRSTAL
jgi:hypothetical protein